MKANILSCSFEWIIKFQTWLNGCGLILHQFKACSEFDRIHKTHFDSNRGRQCLLFVGLRRFGVFALHCICDVWCAMCACFNAYSLSSVATSSAAAASKGSNMSHNIHIYIFFPFCPLSPFAHFGRYWFWHDHNRRVNHQLRVVRITLAHIPHSKCET